MTSSPAALPVAQEIFGHYSDGRPVRRFTLDNQRRLRVSLMEHGATLLSVETPDRAGRWADITPGAGSLADWLANISNFGSTVGRYANRIAGARFTLDGQTYPLAANNAPGGIPCHLHGGMIGFSHRRWKGRIVRQTGAIGVALSYMSSDGEEGYPGQVQARVTYMITAHNELSIRFSARTDRPTLVNLINHVYWNLSGDFTRTIADHQVQITAESFLPVTAGLIPTGEKRPVGADGGIFDFRIRKAVGRDWHRADEQLRHAGGYDHCYLLGSRGPVRPVARVTHPDSGRTFELSTDQPGVQFYTGNHFTGETTGKGGHPLRRHVGLCLETGYPPDSPNQPALFDPVLRPGRRYQHRMVFRFFTLPP